MAKKPAVPRTKAAAASLVLAKLPAAAATTALPALLSDADAISDRSTVLYDPATGAIEGIHRVITLPGGRPAAGDDAALAAEALGIDAARRAKLKLLVQDSAPDPEKEFAVQRTGSAVKLVQVALARPVRR